MLWLISVDSHILPTILHHMYFILFMPIGVHSILWWTEWWTKTQETWAQFPPHLWKLILGCDTININYISWSQNSDSFQYFLGTEYLEVVVKPLLKYLCYFKNSNYGCCKLVPTWQHLTFIPCLPMIKINIKVAHKMRNLDKNLDNKTRDLPEVCHIPCTVCLALQMG